jgi:hypothetical protein
MKKEYGMKRKNLCALTLLLTLPALAAVADGGGGAFYGLQTAEYPFLKGYPMVNNSRDLAYFGGYGYGVDGHNVTGGFGFAITDPTGETGIAGGFGGVINGVRLLRWPVNLSLLSWTAIGGISTGIPSGDSDRGFLVIMEELTLELGLPILPWFMPTFYAGYQVAGNLTPGRPFQDFLSYTPVVGLRAAWGKFY